jgi:DNA-binding LacI/PurR family transcriptional regulator
MIAKPAARQARLVDVAEKAGVSVALASVALRGGSRGTIRIDAGTAERIRGVARRMAYRPNMAAQRLKGRKNDVIGVLIGAESTPANHERLAAVDREAYKRGFRLMIGTFHGDGRHAAEYIEDFLARGIDALICFHNPLPPSDRAVKKLLAEAKALVFQTEPLIKGACCVDVDRADGIRQAVEYLHGRGRSRIGLALNCPGRKDPLMADRLRGYRAALADLGIPFDPALIWEGPGTFPPTKALAGRTVEALVRKGGADALVASNDVWAIALIKALRARKLAVPGDVAVVGFDNLEAGALFDPALTSIDQNNAGFAAAAVELLIASLDGQRFPPERRTRVVRPRLVARESA